ncbi:preprotein translocase subunit SecE [Enterococcus dongliensis]|uniref:Protein translocase subunit SecE n=1 Tax=Enterococcus dongliensis TaxID=2559925 RepID=A0AAP5NHE1_9ENTE|nr:preprotein translocase subunit SecE [Enterococcus dongliensis]MDT2596240.1 preprotein translocase subunit SecE [Enterococcus dongliensis]MDT2604630.1 preprotein translocase subunit SecE [Enterococcus dongliensis]MDT2613017.1 preprotein translocase subunit SecE [Enterococcus dongliensis]MDT2634841.1 preprotein translocase subunit SecE [Enterococcus dongliensis]MDT2637862.1 preprotein translocase subunit SecE [Enterococcus dongliensis]
MSFLRSVKEEMKLVTWPSKKQLRHDSLVVIETSIIFALMFFIMDTAIQALINLIIR